MNVFWKHFVLAWAFWAALVVPCHSGVIVDRIVANVNGHVLLQSDWDEELALEAFLNSRPVASYTPGERKEVLDRLIDRELLREQVRPMESLPAEQIAARVAQVRKLYPEAATEEDWRSALERYGLTQAALEKRLGAEMELMRLVEARLRPSVQIDQGAVEKYYHDQLLPELKRAGNPEVPLAEVFGKIKDLLAEQKLNQLLSSWLVSLRSTSHILTPESSNGDVSR